MLRTTKGRVVALLVAFLTFCVAAPGLAQMVSYSPARHVRPPSKPDSVDRALVMTLSKADHDEIGAANAALPTLKDPEVKAFAQMMANDHTHALNELTTIATRLHYPLDPGALTAGTGMTSDAQFIEGQITDHQQLLGELPGSDAQIHDQALRAHLASTRHAVQAHLEKAKSLQSKLSGTMP